MAALHKIYNNFDPMLVEATKMFMEAGPWKGSEGDRIERFQKWWNDAHRLYEMESCPIAYARDLRAMQEYMDRHDHVLVMNSLSVLTLFMAFRQTQVQLGMATYRTNLDHDTEDFAWACGLWYVARPASFRRSVRRGLVPMVTPADLTGEDDRGAEGALTDEQTATFEAIAESVMEDLSADPDIAALLEQFNEEG